MSANAFALSTAVVLSAALLSGCANSPTQVTWQDNGTPYINDQHHQWYHYQYVYYPVSQVYFEPHSHTYWWFNQGVWWEGQQLPEHITLFSEPCTVVKLESAKPYMQHHSVTSAYMFNHQRFDGSDFTTTPLAFASYMDRYNEACSEYRAEQWAMGGGVFVPFGSPFQPFSGVFVNAGQNGAVADNNGAYNNSQYTNGSSEYHNAVRDYVNGTQKSGSTANPSATGAASSSKTAQAGSDQPDS